MACVRMSWRVDIALYVFALKQKTFLLIGIQVMNFQDFLCFPFNRS